MKYCEKCGGFLNDNDEFCGKCGAKIINPVIDNTLSYETEEQTNSSRSAIGIIIHIILSVLVVGCIIFAVIANYIEDTKDSQSSNSNSGVYWDNIPGHSVPRNHHDNSSTSSKSNSSTNNTQKGSQNDFIQYARQALGIPDTLSVSYEISDSQYWQAGERYLTQISFYYNYALIAGAAFDTNTWEMVRNIQMYSDDISSNSGYGIKREYTGYWFHQGDPYTQSINIQIDSDGSFYLRTWRVEEKGYYKIIDKNSINVKCDRYFKGAVQSSFSYDETVDTIYKFENGILIDEYGNRFEHRETYTYVEGQE